MAKSTKICEHCGKEFLGGKNSKYCSRKCFAQHHELKAKTTKKCVYCGKEFIGGKSARFCSRRCISHYNMFFGKGVRKGVVKDTLCRECRKATGGEYCPWVNKFKPVDGWTATPTIVKMGADRTAKSFEVHKCPLFVEG